MCVYQNKGRKRKSESKCYIMRLKVDIAERATDGVHELLDLVGLASNRADIDDVLDSSVGSRPEVHDGLGTEDGLNNISNMLLSFRTWRLGHT